MGGAFAMPFRHTQRKIGRQSRIANWGAGNGNRGQGQSTSPPEHPESCGDAGRPILSARGGGVKRMVAWIYAGDSASWPPGEKDEPELITLCPGRRGRDYVQPGRKFIAVRRSGVNR